MAYLALRRDEEETFLEAFRRAGMEPFQAALYRKETEDAA
jgi:sulfite reductase (NADPH) hemoprotein beta-component